MGLGSTGEEHGRLIEISGVVAPVSMQTKAFGHSTRLLGHTRPLRPQISFRDGGVPITAIASTLGAAVAVVFTVAALSKLRAPVRFAEELGDYQILPGVLLRPAAITIPLIEFIVGVGYFVPAVRSEASWMMAILLLVFSAAVFLNLRRGRRNIRCACFGRDDQLLGWSTLIRNSLLLLAALAAAAAGSRSDQLTSGAGLVGCLLAVTIGTLILAEAEVVETIGGHGNE